MLENGRVVMEGDAVLAELAGIGLADVVEQGGESKHELGTCLVDDGEGMGQHVLVALIWILFHGQ